MLIEILTLNRKTMNQEINNTLSKLYKSEDHTLFKHDLFKEYDTYDNKLLLLDNAMIDEGLITVEKDVRMITSFGLDVCKNGGWLAYLSRAEGEKKDQQDRVKKQDEKLMYDARISKYLYKTRWWPLIISLLSLAIAIWVLFKK